MNVGEPRTVDAGPLLLRPWTTDDTTAIEAISLDPEIARWNPIALPAERWCAARADWSPGTHASWAVVPKPRPDVVLGAVSLHHLDDVQLDSEIGYWVAPDHRRRGVATAALTAASRFAFDCLGLHRVQLFHAVDNAGSCAAATAAAFTYEGTHRDSYRTDNGSWDDEHSHARLSTDPPTIR